MTNPEIMLEEFLSKCYTERQIPVQRSRWKKRIKLHTHCNDLKGSDLTLMNLFNYALSLYHENEQLKQQSIIAQPVDDKVVDKVVDQVDDKVVDKVDDKVVVKATLFSNYRNVEVQRIDTRNHNMGKLFKQEPNIKFSLTKNQLKTFNDILYVLLISPAFGINKYKYPIEHHIIKTIKQQNESSKGTITMTQQQLDTFTHEKYYNDTDKYYLGSITMDLIQQTHHPTDKQYCRTCKPYEKLIEKLSKKETTLDIEEQVEKTIVEKPIVKEQTTEMIDDDSTHRYEDGVKIITSKKNPDINPILRMMRGRINMFHIQVIMMKKSNTQQQISKWFNGKPDAGNPKDILDIYKETTKYCRLSDELYKVYVEGAINHVNQAYNIYMNNFENKELDLRKR